MDNIQKTRTAILLDEDGKEIFRGHPADMPVRFITDTDLDDSLEIVIYDCTMNDAASAGTPIHPDDGSDMVVHDAG